MKNNHNAYIAFLCQPLREAVSWNGNGVSGHQSGLGQPLREAVSWNIFRITYCPYRIVSLFVRLWVEISIRSLCWETRITVSLFVRLWVEIFHLSCYQHCYLRQPLREAVSWNILCIRFWEQCSESASSWGCELKLFSSLVNMVEMSSASSWGCELKLSPYLSFLFRTRQPLREAVSWNTISR